MLSSYGEAVRDVLERRGASFFPEIVAESGLLATQVEQALAELAAAGLVTLGQFCRVTGAAHPVGQAPAPHRRSEAAPGRPVRDRSRRALVTGQDPEPREPQEPSQGDRAVCEDPAQAVWGGVPQAADPGALHGSVARADDGLSPPGSARRDSGRAVRGGGDRRAVRAARGGGRAPGSSAGERGRTLVSISAADPLNLVGIVTPGERIPALARNRILFEDGVPVAVLESGETRFLKEFAPEEEHAIKAALIRRAVSPSLRMYLGIAGRAQNRPIGRRGSGRKRRPRVRVYPPRRDQSTITPHSPTVPPNSEGSSAALR